MDATGYEAIPMEASSMSYSISEPTALEGVFSDYTISFTSPIPIDSTAGCFVKFVFPPELDISNLNLQIIEGSGLFIDSDGSISKTNSATTANLYFDDPQTLILSGCTFDPSEASASQLSHFTSDFFSVTFKDIPNPIPTADLSAFTIQVFKTQDIHLSDLSMLITENTDFKISI